MSFSTIPPSTSPRKLPKKSLTQLIVLSVLVVFVAVSALPNYTSGWPWLSPPKLLAVNRRALQSLPEQGISLPGWVTSEQIKTDIGGDAWSVQQLSTAAEQNDREGNINGNETPALSSIFLLLRPQIYEADQPEVEWLDLKGSQGWTTDSYQTLSFDALANNENDSQPVRVSGDFFRAWNQAQTYAIFQWYAWPTGGSASVAQWFWADQKIQWRDYQRMPWVAVSLWLPIAPLSDIQPYQTFAQSVGESLQTTLLQTVFAKVPPNIPADESSSP
ncbi:MAG: cyanoexosortase B system-associated protein [Phormidesmis sp. RL_2_1]|nr:cyanoexosortase B system-associated protein [Phormidesmis sp. RL_2_1]